MLPHPLQEIWMALPGQGTAATRAALPFATSVCSVSVSKKWYGCQCLGLIVNVLIDTDADDCTQGLYATVRGSALKADSGRKIPCHMRELNPHHDHTCPFGPMLLQQRDLTPDRANIATFHRPKPHTKHPEKVVRHLSDASPSSHRV